MKKYSTLSLLVATSIIFLSPYAVADSPVIYTETTTTPGGKDLRADEARVLAGPTCNSMSTFSIDYSIPVVQKTSGFTSATVIGIAGSGKGCFQVNILYNQKTYSTGPIALTWDNKKNKYVAAYPAYGYMNFH